MTPAGAAGEGVRGWCDLSVGDAADGAAWRAVHLGCSGRCSLACARTVYTPAVNQTVKVRRVVWLQPLVAAVDLHLAMDGHGRAHQAQTRMLTGSHTASPYGAGQVGAPGEGALDPGPAHPVACAREDVLGPSQDLTRQRALQAHGQGWPNR